MELIKKSERNVNVESALKTYRQIGADIKSKGRFMKWKDCPNGRMSVHLDVYIVSIDSDELKAHGQWYVLGDTLGRMAYSGQDNWTDIQNWLSSKGYKTEKDFYTQDYGMTEESYQEWCEA